MEVSSSSFCGSHWESMAGKGNRKQHLPTGDTQESSEGGVDERSLLEIFISNQTKRDEEAEARRLREKKDQLEAEERAEARRLKAEIAAEEREERRRERAKVLEAERLEKAKIAEEERAEKAKVAEAERLLKAKLAEEERIEARALEKEKRKLEEARRQEDLLKRSEEQTKQAAEKAAYLQEEAAQKAFDQQKELMELQAELGKKAAETQREESQRVRQKDRAVASVTAWQKGEDMEDFLLSSERKLRAGGIPEEEWLGVVASKLSGEVGAKWQELCLCSDDYQEVRGAVLMGCGYTQKADGEAYHAFGAGNLRGMSADQVLRKGVQLLRRMVAPEVLSKRIEFLLVKPWVYANVGRRARAVLEARTIESGEDLVKALQDHLASDGDRLAGRVAVFGIESTGPRRPTFGVGSGAEPRKAGLAGSNGSSLKCFRCGKIGHKVADCWQGGGVASGTGAKAASSSGGKVVCYTCGVDGHKSTECPKREGSGKGSVSKPVRQLWVRDSRDTVIEGVVNGKGASLLLDSGAHITIVPEDMVEEKLRTGKSVCVRPFQSKTFIKLPTAKVRFELEGLDAWEEEVALAPVEQGKESEVLYGLDLKSARGLDLVILANRQGEADVRRVTTRAEAKREVEEKKETSRVVEVEKPRVRPVGAKPAGVPVRKPAVKKSEVAEAVSGAVKAARNERVQGAGKPKPSAPVVRVACKEGTGTGKLVADRPASNPEPVTLIASAREGEILSEEVCLSDEEEWPDLHGLTDSSEEEVELVSDDQDDLSEGVAYCLRKEGRVEDLEVPPVKKGPGDRARLVKEVGEDPSLEGCRTLAGKGEQGYIWKDGLLYQARMGAGDEVLVLPKSFRSRVLEMAHEGSGHLGARKVKALLKQRFVWPGMGVDAIKHTRSCEVCQKCAKGKGRSVPLMEREVLSEPFEVLAFDLVGPFPKAKNGYRFLLTAVCMGSKWPEAVPLKSETAKAVANGMVEIFARTGVPLKLLTDQGSQFLGSLVKHLCKDLRIDQVKTAPYHPECNGVVERMHGTLVPMLTKASQLGMDWVEQLPFTLFALRSAPNRDTKFSPYQLVYGHRVRTPLDILHQGWAEEEFSKFDTSEWADWLVARLAVWHESVLERGKEASGCRKHQYDKSTVNRTLEVGDQVLCRIPGHIGKLRESWHGPYSVVARKSRVDYAVDFGKGNGRVKVLHINNLKRFYPREERVLRLALVAEDWSEDEAVGTKLLGECKDFNGAKVVEELRREYPEVFSDLPGKTSVCKLSIGTGEAEPRASHPYRIPNKLKEGVRREIENLVELGIVEPSTSPWASPVVPVPKSDGSVRVCVDYRKLNSVTEADPYYMNTLEEILERVGDSKIMSKLDLAKGFYQVEVEPTSQEKTAFVSPFGKFQFRRMPFGLKNAPAVFQRLMEVVLRGCYRCSAPYIDDIIVFSRSVEEHGQHLRCVLAALRKFGLTIKEEKCQWGREKVEYLGHVIGGGQLAVPLHRAAAMANYIQPTTKRQLRSFLGAAGYYRQFVKGYANLSAVLTPLTAKNAPSVVCWTLEGLEAFANLKVSLVDVCALTVPTQQDTYVLHTDASGRGIGATLNVVRDGRKLPVAYFSKQLQGAQHRYSATELEGLAVFKAIHYFAHYLFGCRFVVLTDHKALVSFLHSRILNRRLHGWMLQLLQFDFSIEYRPGSENSDADALSRQAWDTRVGGPWQMENGLEEIDGETSGLRAAPSCVVGGDVGTEAPHKKKGVATAGVALPSK